MIVFGAALTENIEQYLKNRIGIDSSLSEVNRLIKDDTGIDSFFDSDDLEYFKEIVLASESVREDIDRTEYGDFQTSLDLAGRVVSYLVSKSISPEVVIEPTCGKGNFIIAALQQFKDVKYVYGIEVFKPYVWEAKFGILNFFLENPSHNKPDITIHHCNVFEFDFSTISIAHASSKVLVVGNPPWITNSKLSTLNSNNLPEKSNFKNHVGFDAITGKGNFDIGEYVTLMVLKAFQHHNGNMAFLVKNTVIKNILFDQRHNCYNIGDIEKLLINSKKEFDVAVEAALLCCSLNSKPEFDCKEMNFYVANEGCKQFGWFQDKFVSNLDLYLEASLIDGLSPHEWRQGLKHDCSAIMEFEKQDSAFQNSLGDKVILEDGLVYGLLKSSDLKGTVVREVRKYTIVTQKTVGQETDYIKEQFPNTFSYLEKHQESFNARKSSIYKNKPAFSIFGIGDYSFKPYKVAISGMYKTFHFSLVPPLEGKPIMLDDTCYFIGFDLLEHAVYATLLLNTYTTKKFLQSITFPDAKRTFTKDVLMRIDLKALASNISCEDLQSELSDFNRKHGLEVQLNHWESFIEALNGEKEPKSKPVAGSKRKKVVEGHLFHQA